jgi:hypothetical protein
MATGFPTKANWSAGDVLTASALDDLAGTVNLLSNASATSGSQLVSNAAGTSFAYQPTPSASNPVLNSAMQVAQRGTSIALAASTGYASGYTLDRWQTFTSANQAVTVARVATGDTTNLPNIQYALRYQRNSGQTGTSTLPLNQSFETANSVPLAGKPVTLSFYARAGANFSATSSLLTVGLITGTGTDQNQYAGYTGAAYPINTTATLTTTWQRFQYTTTLTTTVTELSTYFAYTPVGTAGTNDYYDITGVQIDVGSVALPFRTNGATYQAELAACQRYFQSYGSYDFTGDLYSTSAGVMSKDLPVTMRIAPTPTYPAAPFTGALTQFATGAATPTAVLTATANATTFTFYATGASGLSAAYFCVWTGSTIQLSSEL